MTYEAERVLAKHGPEGKPVEFLQQTSEPEPQGFLAHPPEAEVTLVRRQDGKSLPSIPFDEV